MALLHASRGADLLVLGTRGRSPGCCWDPSARAAPPRPAPSSWSRAAQRTRSASRLSYGPVNNAGLRGASPRRGARM